MAYHRRLLDALLDDLLTELPAILLVGPRASGKTTTALQRAHSVIRLDVPGEAAAFRADPDAVLRGMAEPVLLDEWQAVPEAFSAVKRAVDAAARPQRFILTGSACSA
jgi:predicted AAA+ superfamily ATPase